MDRPVFSFSKSLLLATLALALPAMERAGARVGQTPAPTRGSARADLVRAYREDLVDMAQPMHLDLKTEGQLLAEFLCVGAWILKDDPFGTRDRGRRPVVADTILNPADLDEFSEHFILARGRRCTLLGLAGDPDAGGAANRYWEPRFPGEPGYVAFPWGPEGSEADEAHGLIVCLYFLMEGKGPTLDEIQTLRAVVADRLTDDQIAQTVGILKWELLWNPAQYPELNGCFATLGPRVSAWLKQDRVFLTARHQALTGWPGPLATLRETPEEDAGMVID